MIRILIADDHTIVREGLKQIIADISGMEVTDEATNGNEAISKIRRDGFDVVLLGKPVHSSTHINHAS